MQIELRPFQRRFLDAALAPGVDIACLSLPRANGKSWLASHILTRCMTPGDSLFQAGKEYLMLAGSLTQARIIFRFVRSTLDGRKGYRWEDSTLRIGVTHVPSKTRLRVVSSNAKQAFGIVDTPVVVADEPGSWNTAEGTLMADALETALGKPGSALRVIYVGTLAPAKSGWWHDLVAGGSRGRTHVTALQGNRETWDSWQTIRKANPLTAISPELRHKLLEERDAARTDPRLKARFMSYRLNLPSADESEMLLAVDDWERMTARAVPERQGKPIVAIDLGGGRAWSAAVCVYQSGRIEALASAPGIPDIAAQEKRDRVPPGTYQALVTRGLLHVSDGLRVQPPSALWAAIVENWGVPVNVVCDRFRLPELLDAIGGACPVEPRVTRWSESSADIRGLQKGVKDGPFAVAEGSRLLLAESLAAALVKHDDAGNTRMVKDGTHNVGRDDVAAALALVGGAFDRAASVRRSGPGYAVVTG